jgi:hypothetical protein
MLQSMWMLPIEMLPMASGVVLTAVLSYFFGFSQGVVWGVIAFFVIQPLVIMIARGRGGLEMGDRVPPPLAPLGCLFVIGSLYLFLRLWLWAPEELWFGQAYPFLGALGTGILFFLISALVQTVILALSGPAPK